MRPLKSRRLWHHMVARTIFFDGQVLAAISAGIDQVVICGAGYDDRGLRFRSPGVRFFELDHPSTQADKSRRLRAHGIYTSGLTLAPADFRTDDIVRVLDGCGHDPARASLLICEGLLVYLEQPICARLLSGLRSHTGLGSVLAASLATHPAGVDSSKLVAAANARRRAGRSEPWHTILPRDAHLAIIEQAGWRMEQTVDAVELDPSATPGSTELVTATAGRYS
jgi:methyltransferase (TIGR00027 family)